MNVKLWQVIFYPILVMLIVLGCVTVYQRETAMLSNQINLNQKIEDLKTLRFSDNKEIQRVIENEIFPRLSGVEQSLQAKPNKK